MTRLKGLLNRAGFDRPDALLIITDPASTVAASGPWFCKVSTKDDRNQSGKLCARGISVKSSSTKLNVGIIDALRE